MKARFVAAAAIMLAPAACKSVRPLWEPEEFLARAKPSLVYVTQRDRVTMAIVNPSLVADTLRGTAFGEDRPVAVPWDQVVDVAARRIHGGRTALMITGVTVVSALTVYAFVQGSSGHSSWYCDYNTPALDGAGAPTCGPGN
jgi:hypothetical protein